MKQRMMIKSQKAMQRAARVSNKLVRRMREFIEDERGEGVVVTIIFVAILALAVLATQSTVRDVFTDSVDSFKTWIANKLSTLFV